MIARKSTKRKVGIAEELPPGVVLPPRLPKHLPSASLPGGRLADGEQYAALALVGGDLSGQVADTPSFSRVSFARMELSGTQLRRPQMADVRFAACNLANARWDAAILRRVEFVGCRLLGFSAGAEGFLREVLFRD